MRKECVMNENESIGTLISKRRKYMGLTQEELAGRIGVSKSAIAKWETDGGLPDRDNLKLLSEAINVPIDVFYRIIRRSDRGKKTKVNTTPRIKAAPTTPSRASLSGLDPKGG